MIFSKNKLKLSFPKKKHNTADISQNKLKLYFFKNHMFYVRTREMRAPIEAMIIQKAILDSV
jgi:hypothetical protein